MNLADSDFTSVYTTDGKLAGEMIRGFLEAQGIPAIVVQESAGTALGLTVGRMGVVKIFVPTERADEATELLDKMDEGEFEQTLPDSELNEDTDPEEPTIE